MQATFGGLEPAGKWPGRGVADESGPQELSVSSCEAHRFGKGAVVLKDIGGLPGRRDLLLGGPSVDFVTDLWQRNGHEGLNGVHGGWRWF